MMRDNNVTFTNVLALIVSTDTRRQFFDLDDGDDVPEKPSSCEANFIIPM